MSDSVHIIYVSLPPVRGFLADGRVRALAVVSAKRTSVTPDIVAVGEVYPEIEPIEVLSGFSAPKGTPSEIITRLNTELNAILKMPDVVERLVTTLGVEIRGGRPENWKAAQEKLYQQFKRATEAMNLQPQ